MSSSECPAQPIRYGLALQAAFEVLTVQGAYMQPLGAPGIVPRVEDDLMDAPRTILEPENDHQLPSTPRSTTFDVLSMMTSATVDVGDLSDFGDLAVDEPATEPKEKVSEKSIGLISSSSMVSFSSSSEMRADTSASPCDSSLDKVIKQCLSSNPFTPPEVDTAGGDGTESGIRLFDSDPFQVSLQPSEIEQEKVAEAETKTSEWTYKGDEQEPIAEHSVCGSTVSGTTTIKCSEDREPEEQKAVEMVIKPESLERKKPECEQPKWPESSTPNRKPNQPKLLNPVKRSESMKILDRKSPITIKRAVSSRLMKRLGKTAEQSGSPKKMSAHDQKCLNHPRWLNRLR